MKIKLIYHRSLKVHHLLKGVCPEIGYDRPGQTKLIHATIPIRSSFSEIVLNNVGNVLIILTFSNHQTNVTLYFFTSQDIFIAIIVGMVHVLASNDIGFRELPAYFFLNAMISLEWCPLMPIVGDLLICTLHFHDS